jgi:menaquinone-dependent protoporphyrinogen oxidase
VGNRVLVAYATRAGSAGEVATTIAETLRQAGQAAEVRPARDVTDLCPYQAVIVGSAIYMGQWMPDAVKFVRRHRQTLSQKPVAYYAVCLTLKDDTEENRCTVAAYLDPVRTEVPEVKPVDVGLFAGRLDYGKLSFLYRTIIKKMGAPEGDYRDEEAIRAWAASLPPKLALS